MFKLKSNKNQKINGTQLVQLLFYSFPLCFIVGNFALNLNTFLFIAVSLFVIQRKQLTFRFNNSNWLLIAFFLYFFISTTIQFQSAGFLSDEIQKYAINQNWSLINNPIIRSFFLIRFLILIFVIDTLFFNKILNLKKLFLSSLFCTSFVCFDIILQYITGFDLFGYKRMGSWNMGPFGDEWIAGGYLKNFSFFSFFYIFETFKNKKFGNLLLIFVIALHLVAILLSGNRMQMILFVFGCILLIFLIKNLRFAMSIGLLIFLSAFFLLVNYDKYENTNWYKASYKLFINELNIKKFVKINKDISTTQNREKIELNKNVKDPDATVLPKEIKFLRNSGYNRIFRTSIEMWKENPLFGFGFKSFRVKCWDMLAKDNAKRKTNQKPQYITCANHPHNYYLEFLSEAGIIGTSLLVVFFLILLKDSFYYLKKYRQQINSELNLLIPVIILFFLEIWPIKSTGSFFTTWGATFFWINAAILIAAKTKKSF